jgi:hypothetical protein
MTDYYPGARAPKTPAKRLRAVLAVRAAHARGIRGGDGGAAMPGTAEIDRAAARMMRGRGVPIVNIAEELGRSVWFVAKAVA